MKKKCLLTQIGRRQEDGKPYAKYLVWSDKGKGWYHGSMNAEGNFDFGFTWLTDDQYDEMKLQVDKGFIFEIEIPAPKIV